MEQIDWAVGVTIIIAVVGGAFTVVCVIYRSGQMHGEIKGELVTINNKLTEQADTLTTLNGVDRKIRGHLDTKVDVSTCLDFRKGVYGRLETLQTGVQSLVDYQLSGSHNRREGD